MKDIHGYISLEHTEAYFSLMTFKIEIHTKNKQTPWLESVGANYTDRASDRRFVGEVSANFRG
jgi:hypothetical protein